MKKIIVEKSKTVTFPIVIGEEADLEGIIGGREALYVTNDNMSECLNELSEDMVYVLSLVKENFAKFLEEIGDKKDVKWILAPKRPMEMVYNGGVPYFTYPEAVYLDMDVISNLSNDDFYELIAYAMRFGMEQSTNLYGYIINHLYELCDLDYETLEELFEMIYKVHERIMVRKTKEERNHLSLPEVMGEFYDSLGLYKHSDAIAYGCINGAYYSYRNEFISTEDYYEIRDMFVPFGLSIMQTKRNKAELLDAFRKFLKEKNYEKEIRSMKKIGKLDQCVDFDKWLDEALFEAVFFDEESNE